MSQKSKLSLEEKVKIILKYMNGEVGLNSAAAEAGVSHETLRQWIMQYQAEGAIAFLPGRKAHTYSPELKLQAVQEYLAGEGSLMEISTKYGVRDKKTLRSWIKVYNTHGDFNSVKSSGGGNYMNGKTKNVIASLCAVAALAFAGIGGYMVGQSPAQPRDISASDRVEQQDMVVGTVGAISIPGFSRLSFKAGQTAQNVAFYNPEGNTCAFEISIILPSGKEIFHSGRLLPGEKLEQIEIDAALPAAIYEATTLRYSCFSLDEAERELNGADTSCILEVLP